MPSDVSADQFMTPTDAFIWRVERDPLMRWTISAIIMLDGAPPWDALTERFERLTRLVPRLREHIVEPPLGIAPPRWTPDPYFDLDFHLRRVAAPDPADLSAVMQLACTSAMGGLDRDRPLWEATFVEDLADAKTALVLKIHHSLTDGIGGVQLAQLLADPLDGSEPEPVPEPPPAEKFGTADLWRDITRHHVRRSTTMMASAARRAGPTAARLVRNPLGSMQDGTRLAASILRTVRPISDTKSPVMTERGFSWHFEALEVPFDQLHDAATSVEATVNDAFVASITGGLRRYHEELGRPVDELRMSMPISTRTAADDPGGNHVAIIRFPVPVGVADPAKRMRQTHKAALAARDEPAVPYTDAVLELLTPVTPMAVGSMAKRMDFTASNVPGIPVEGRLCGVPVTRIFPFGPTGGAAMNATMLSYNGTCCVGINSDTAAVRDGALLQRCLAAGFEEVTALAGWAQ